MALLGKFLDALCCTAKRIIGLGCNKSPKQVPLDKTETNPTIVEATLTAKSNNKTKKQSIVKVPRIWEYKGERKTAAEWAKIYGVCVSTMRYRLTNLHSPEEPPQENHLKDYIKQPSKHEYNGQEKTVAEWAEELGVSPTTIRVRLRKYGSVVVPEEDLSPIADFKDIRLIKNGSDCKILVDGCEYSLYHFARKFGLNFSTLYGRIAKGWDIQKSIKAARKVNRDYSQKPPVKAKVWEWKGEKHTAQEWAQKFGISIGMMRKRLARNGTPERNTDRLDAYKSKRARLLTWNGQTHTIKEWAKIYKVPERTMFGRWKRHNSPEHVENTYIPSTGRLLEWKGEKHTAREWAEIYKVPERTMYRRWKEHNAPVLEQKVQSVATEHEKAVREKSYTWNGTTKLVSEWAKQYNCKPRTIHKRFRKHGSPEPSNIKQKETCKDEYLFWFDNDWKPLKEWAAECGVSKEETLENFKRYGRPTKPSRTTPDKRKGAMGESSEAEDSDAEVYEYEGEWKTLEEWAQDYGMSIKDVQANFKRYGSPTKPLYMQRRKYGYEPTSEYEIDEMLKEVDRQQKLAQKKAEPIHDWLERIKNEPDDHKMLRDINEIEPLFLGHSTAP